MAVRGPGASVQSLTVLERTARLYEGERWWLFDPNGEVRGLLLFDGGEDLLGLPEGLAKHGKQGYRFSPAAQGAALAAGHPARTGPDRSRPDCQVSVEERTQLFGFLKKG